MGTLDALANVAAKASTAYELLTSACVPLLRYGNLAQAKLAIIAIVSEKTINDNNEYTHWWLMTPMIHDSVTQWNSMVSWTCQWQRHGMVFMLWFVIWWHCNIVALQHGHGMAHAAVGPRISWGDAAHPSVVQGNLTFKVWSGHWSGQVSLDSQDWNHISFSLSLSFKSGNFNYWSDLTVTVTVTPACLTQADQDHRWSLERLPVSSKPQVRLSRGGAAYSVRQLYEYLTLGVHLRNQKRLKTVLQTAYHLATGNFSDYIMQQSSDGVFQSFSGGGSGGLLSLAPMKTRRTHFDFDWPVWLSLASGVVWLFSCYQAAVIVLVSCYYVMVS